MDYHIIQSGIAKVLVSMPEVENHLAALLVSSLSFFSSTDTLIKVEEMQNCSRTGCEKSEDESVKSDSISFLLNLHRAE